MSADNQTELATLLLEHLADYSFALAGSCAIREYGLTDRPTRDIDIFGASTLSPELFKQALSTLIPHVEQAGWKVTFLREIQSTFAQAKFERNETVLEADFGVDWRSTNPTTRDVGPVISIEDAVASKVSALYSRRLSRDYLDVYSIRKNGPFSDDKLLELTQERDPGFELEMFANQLELVQVVSNWRIGDYDLSDHLIEDVRSSSLTWAQDIRASL
ncbi:nucleotidyl transferase AbiEii/AbiGii toxin family protein [Schaalia sp. ZJ405]|uniref:nucleotidyl transferase AbiEii/AbiGii toxin family protein n=1 Tax=Schaalia sp. ZJ405 TaxID=2709403 RepID=UPI0013EC65A7|nr:nucleotidyl transferase AbiEii/AbiGii toxin family protein [Schaalia sp. ZJ405]QPK81498.1 nucleotidyl transferase AbiEii/AbiGii toxin family protein [Schaalia sp. ZJ405]